MLLGSPGAIGQGLHDVLALQIRIGGQYLVHVAPGGDVTQDHADRDAHAAYAGLATHHTGLGRVLEQGLVALRSDMDAAARRERIESLTGRVGLRRDALARLSQFGPDTSAKLLIALDRGCKVSTTV